VITVRCSFCGRKEELAEDHKDYPKLQVNPKTIYICNICSNRARYDASETQKPKKPM